MMKDRSEDLLTNARLRQVHVDAKSDKIVHLRVAQRIHLDYTDERSNPRTPLGSQKRPTTYHVERPYIGFCDCRN